MAREVLPHLGKMPIAEVRKRDIIAVIDQVVDRAPVRANRVLAHVKRLFRWAAGRDLIEVDPAVHIEKPTAERRRDRVLDDRELADIWQAAAAMGGPFGAGVQLLIATGARREEIFGLAYAEVDPEAACIRLPAARDKVNEARHIPLSRLALGILADLPHLGPYVLSSRGDKPFGNIGRGKAVLDSTIARQRAEKRLGRELMSDEPVAAGDQHPSWRLHDLRRTVASGMQRLA
jgi:integrase